MINLCKKLKNLISLSGFRRGRHYPVGTTVIISKKGLDDLSFLDVKSCLGVVEGTLASVHLYHEISFTTNKGYRHHILAKNEITPFIPKPFTPKKWI